VNEFMNKNAERIMSDSTLGLVAQNMKKYNCDFMPVIEHVKGYLCGVISSRDIAKGIANGKDSKSLVNEVMTTKLIYVNEKDDLEKALQLMKENMIRRILVVNDNHMFVGLISLNDLVVSLRDDEKLGSKLIEMLRLNYENRGVI